MTGVAPRARSYASHPRMVVSTSSRRSFATCADYRRLTGATESLRISSMFLELSVRARGHAALGGVVRPAVVDRLAASAAPPGGGRGRPGPPTDPLPPHPRGPRAP